LNFSINFSILKEVSMRHRIFIAINLPEDIKNQLAEYQSRWPELSARWTKKENLHITLAFLGYLSDEELLEVLRITKEIASKNQAFSIKLNKIIYGPPKKMPPRMVWVEGEKRQELAKLRKDLESSILASPIKIMKEPENRSYTPHITLGRIRAWEFRQIEPEERPDINEDISLSFEVNSVEVMESQLKRGGAEYAVLESAPLKS